MTSRIVYTPRGIKKSRSLRLPLMGVAASVAIIAAAALIIATLRSPALRIKTVAVSGADILDPGAIRDAALATLAGSRWLVIPRASFFLADGSLVARDLEYNFPSIRSVNVSREFPATLRVDIAERDFWGIYCNGLESSSTPVCAFMDLSGFAYARSPEPRGVLVRIVRSDITDPPVVGSQALNPGLMETIRALERDIPAYAGVEIREFHFSARIPSEISVIAREGFTLIVKREDDGDTALRALARVLAEEIRERRPQLDYIDLRFGNKVFYKLR